MNKHIRFILLVTVVFTLFISTNTFADNSTIEKAIATDSKTVEVTFTEGLDSNLNTSDFTVQLYYGDKSEIEVQSASVKESDNKVVTLSLTEDMKKAIYFFKNI